MEYTKAIVWFDIKDESLQNAFNVFRSACESFEYGGLIGLDGRKIPVVALKYDEDRLGESFYEDKRDFNMSSYAAIPEDQKERVYSFYAYGTFEGRILDKECDTHYWYSINRIQIRLSTIDYMWTDRHISTWFARPITEPIK